MQAARDMRPIGDQAGGEDLMIDLYIKNQPVPKEERTGWSHLLLLFSN